MTRGYYKIVGHPDFDPNDAHLAIKDHKGVIQIATRDKKYEKSILQETPGVELIPVSEFREAYESVGRVLENVQGCSDGFCLISGPAKGMHTNGGCHCVKNIEARRTLTAFWRLWGTMK